MTFDSTTQDVTVTLRDSFSTINTFPFTVNDKILVENTSVGVGSTGLGYNSANYDYSLFTVTKTHPNLGGIGIVTFSMAGFLESGEIPGFYNTGNSSGVIVPEKFFPTFDPTLETLGFREQDEITDGTSVGKVYQLDTESKYLVVESDNDFKVGTEILSVPTFSTINTFPFTVNDKILVENTSVGVGSTGLGYNSANYDYSLFTVTKTHPNLGGIGIVTFSMAGFLESGEIPGFYNTGNSSGVIVPEKFFPTFDPTLETLGFREQDEITDGTSVGKVYQLDTESKYLVVESDNDFKVGTEILSEVTGSKGLVKERIAFDSKYSLDYYSVRS